MLYEYTSPWVGIELTTLVVLGNVNPTTIESRPQRAGNIKTMTTTSDDRADKTSNI